MRARSVLWRLFVRELHEQTRTHRFAVLTAVAALMTPMIVYAGIRDYDVRRVQYHLLIEQRAGPDGQRNSNRLLGRQLEPALRLIRPPTLSSLLVRGFSGTLPQYWDFAPDGLHPGPAGDSASRSPQSGVSLDMEFLVRVVLGLLAILLAAGALAEERYSGTFYVLMTQPVRPLQLFLARLGGGLVALALALTLVITGFVAAIAVIEADLWSVRLAMTVLAFGVASMMFLAVLYSIGLVIGAVAASTSAANVAAASVWVIVAVASVPTTDFIARIVAPLIPPEVIESRRQSTFAARMREGQLELGNWYLGVAGPSWRTVEMSTEARDNIRKVWTAKARDIRRDLERIDQEASKQASRERAMWAALSWFTPGTLFFDATSRLGTTGLPAVDRWDAASRSRQDLLNAALFDDPAWFTLLLPDKVGVLLLPAELRPPVEAGALRLPEPPEVTLGQAFRDALPPLVGLGICQILLFCFSFLAFRRINY